MEKNKQSLQLSRTALTITLVIWFLALTVFLAYTFFLSPMFFLYLIPTILNIIISYEKRYEQDDFFGMIVITLLSYIIFGIIVISIAPFLFYIFVIFFIPQTIFLILACLTFKKIEQK